MPYTIVGGIRFYERKEIKDVLAYLRVMVNPNDEESLSRIINYPPRGIGAVSLDRIQSYAASQGLGLFEAMEHEEKISDLGDRSKQALKQFAGLIAKYRKLRSEMSLSECVRSLVDELGILAIFKEERTAESMSRWENVQELLSAISEFTDDHPEGTLEQFLEEVSLISDIDTYEGTRNVVTLMTLHSSKGLEFPVVLITGIEEGLLPFYSASIEPAELEEERRLFYVGITRAEKKLYLAFARMRYRFGDPTYLNQSRFLSEIGGDNIILKRSKSLSSVVSLRDNGAQHPSRSSGAGGVVEEEHYHKDYIPDYESESQEPADIRQGAIVTHETFGRGKIVAVSGKGDSRKAVVNFENYGMKSLMVKFARLRSG
jgi:DNA helicase-2/ATP-dependent DNA helicase PcrA